MRKLWLALAFIAGGASAAQVNNIGNFGIGNPSATRVLMVSTTGCNDASTTPWLTTTPLCTIKEAVSRAQAGSIIALKPGSCHRITSNGEKPIISVDGSSSKPIIVDGGFFGPSRACIRGSTIPAVTLTTGSIYRLTGTFSTDPLSYVYYVPNGTVELSADATCSICASNVRKLTKTAGAQFFPGVGEYGRDGTTMYVNVGRSITTGEIEVPANIVSGLFVDNANWTFRNLELSFFEDKGINLNGALGTRIEDTNIWYNGSDGIDLFNGAGLTCSNMVIAFNGRGLGDAAHGDGISAHDTDTVACTGLSFIHNDKSGNGSQSPSVSTYDRSLFVGNQPVWLANGDTGGGSMTVTNSIIIVPAGMPAATGAKNTTTTALAGSLTIRYSSIYSVERTPGFFGVSQRAGQTSAVTVVNSIISGFATAVELGAGNFTGENWACFDNGTNVCSGAITTDPLFVDPPVDMHVEAGSPMKAQAQVIPGVTVDYFGNARSGTPTIGAAE